MSEIEINLYRASKKTQPDGKRSTIAIFITDLGTSFLDNNQTI